jgi:hypothetical protein
MTVPSKVADGHRLFPVNIRRERGRFMVTLRDIAPEAFTDPFVAETIARLPGETAERPLDDLADAARDAAAIAPRGIIYHVSKCGSTLVSQVLKQLDDVVVYSQPNVLNDLLTPPHAGNADEMMQALRRLGALFAAHAGRPYVLKLESWNVLYCGLLQRAFPGTPWVFCIRDPIDVAVSVLEDPDPGLWYPQLGCDRNPFFAGFGLPTDRKLPAGEHIALFYAQFCEAIRQLPRRTGRIIHYDSMPASVWTEVTAAFNLAISAGAQARMERAAEFYSKDPQGSRRRFVADSADKRRRVAADVRIAIDAKARPLYEQILQDMADA